MMLLDRLTSIIDHAMSVHRRRMRVISAVIVVAAGAGCRTESHTPSDSARGSGGTTAASSNASACRGDNAGLTLPPGFCATVFADSIGHARHIVVAANGDVYVNTWSGRYFGGDKGPPGGYLVVLRDTTGDGRADLVARFGATSANGQGGTGIALHGASLYAEEGGTIVRYTLTPNGGAPASAPQTIVSGLPTTGDHPMHPFAIDSSGTLYVDLGSASNSCQLKNRVPNSPGHNPCTELETRGGIWAFDADKTGQVFSPATRYATGIRNAVGITIGPDGHLWSTQHGRDQLWDNWQKLYTMEQGENLPAEELLQVNKGDDFGWPYCYFDNQQQKLVLAPEYGGDGGKAVGECSSKKGPAAFFPAHWAPDGLLFYTGTKFPARYRDGAFIAFHGSWNRAPGPQGGYQVVFQPLSSGKAAGNFETFANGFAGGVMQPDAAKHRPVGLAQGPDGSLYIADDKAGRVYRVTYGPR
jgi:glucose/arabinose dehydrogenase